MKPAGPAFSRRVPDDLAPNRLTTVLAGLRARGVGLLDLTETNPTRVGLAYPPDTLAALADTAALIYEPEPFGMPSARAAVAADFRRRGVEVDAARIALTSSTSEAYGLLFKLLCEPGDQVLVPQPSYPLFDHLTRLEAVETRPYRLEYHGSWMVDVGSVERALTRQTRAILVVSPNNPTGSFITAGELAALGDICADGGLALIGDEVFADYIVDGAAPDTTRSVLAAPRALTFALGGLSKSAGLPQVKLGWIATGGPDVDVARALSRLEIICDTYLSVSTPVQRAAASLIATGSVIRARVTERVTANRRRLEALASQHPACTAFPVGAGWSAVLQVPATRSEEELIIALAEQDHVLAHPGYFFDFPREAFIVISLLPEPGVFETAVARLLARAGT